MQIYALRGSPGIGDFGALAAFCEDAALAGADAVMISPVHALADGGVSPRGAERRLLAIRGNFHCEEARGPSGDPLIVCNKCDQIQPD